MFITAKFNPKAFLPLISLIHNPGIKTPVSIWQFLSVNHALLIWCYRNAALVFKTYGGHCVACSVDMVAFYSSSLHLRVVFLLMQRLSAIAIARLLKVGLTFVKKIRKKKNILNTSTVDYPARTGKARQMDSIRGRMLFWRIVGFATQRAEFLWLNVYCIHNSIEIA